MSDELVTAYRPTAASYASGENGGPDTTSRAPVTSAANACATIAYE